MSGSQLHCPSCAALLKVAHRPTAGNPLRCSQCSTVFAAPDTEAGPSTLQPGTGSPEAVLETAAETRVASTNPEAVQLAADLSPRTANPSNVGPKTSNAELPFPGPPAPAGKRKGRRFVVSTLILFAALALGAGIGTAVVFWPWRTPEQPVAVSGLAGPSSPPSSSRPEAGAPGVFDDWLQDPERARQKASKEGKDILMLFDGSDWCPFCVQMTEKVLSKPEFRERVGRCFVLVYLDFPQQPQARARVHNQARNTELLDEYTPGGYPTIVLTDAQGRAYVSFGGYNQEPVEVFTENLLKLQQQRVERDRLFAAIDRAGGAARVERAREALAFLEGRGLVRYYGPLVAEWTKMARELDPRNEKGYVEAFFQADWLEEVARTDQTRPEEMVKPVGRLDQWKKQYRFKDQDLAGKLHLVAGNLLTGAGQYDTALGYIKEGLAYKPADRQVVQGLSFLEARLTYAGSGTGFIVAPGGYVVTNYHVVGGAGRIVVRVTGAENPVPAEVVAQDPRRDLAVVRIKGPSADRLQPLSLNGKRVVQRGEKVAAFGFPLGDLVGSGLKLTTGVVSALPEPGTDDLLVLDARINPGNSGGPVCDSAGNVVGMVAAKSFAAGPVESYGMAATAQELDGFLRKHLRAYQPSAAAGKSLTWEEVDRIVSPSVVRVYRKR